MSIPMVVDGDGMGMNVSGVGGVRGVGIRVAGVNVHVSIGGRDEDGSSVASDVMDEIDFNYPRIANLPRILLMGPRREVQGEIARLPPLPPSGLRVLTWPIPMGRRLREIPGNDLVPHCRTEI